MSAGATLFQDVADAAKAALDAAAITIRGQKAVVYAHEPMEADALPSIYIRPPTFEILHDQDQRIGDLGRRQWVLDFPLISRVRMDTPDNGQADAGALISQMVDAIDADPTLGGTAQLTAVIVSGEPDLDETVASTRVSVYRSVLRAMTQTNY